MLKLDIHDIKGFRPKEEEKYRYALDLMIKAVNSSAFRKWFLSPETFFEPYPSSYNKWSINPNGPGRYEMYDEIMSGKDLFGTKDGDIDIKVKRYYRWWSRVLGYTYMNSMLVYMNAKYILNREVAAIAGTIFHEYLHNCGFSHSSKWTSRRKDTLAYKTGYKVRDLITESLKGKTTDPKDPPLIIKKPIYKPSIWYRVKYFFKRMFS